MLRQSGARHSGTDATGTQSKSMLCGSDAETYPGNEVIPKYRIQRIKDFLQGDQDKKQGLFQENTEAPATWQQISSLLVNTQRRTGHRVTVRCPISKGGFHQVGILYVDDTTL